MLPYKKILLKLSGEALKVNDSDIFDVDVLNKLSLIVKKIVDEGIKVGIVVGGGNIMRGRNSNKLGLERVNLDYIGMLATNINALLLQNVFTKNGIEVETFSALPVKDTIEEIDVKKANIALDNNKVVIFGGGTGKPFVSTDTAASLRAKEINADVILAGKHGVDGVYNDDPNVNKEAFMYKEVSYDEIIKNSIKALDIEAIKICKENNTIIRVFNMDDLDNILKVLEDTNMGTTIRKD